MFVAEREPIGVWFSLILVLMTTIHLVSGLKSIVKRLLTGLLTIFFSFISFSYKVRLFFVDRVYKINRSFLSFNKDMSSHIYSKGINFLNSS